MNAHSRSASIDIASQLGRGLGRRHEASPDVRQIDETVTLRRCAMYRKAFQGAAISYPAAVLRSDAVATWIRRHGVGLNVTTAEELDRAMAAGIAPLRIVMHCRDGSAGPTRLAVNARIGRFVVNSSQQLAILASGDRRPQRVLIDVTAESADALATEVVSRGRLDLIGLHCGLGDTGDAAARSAVFDMVGQMSRIRREYGVILTRLSFAEGEARDGCCERSDPSRVAGVLDDAVEDASARYRYPQPVLVLSPRRSALLVAE
jgi:diaminopimelate decarboxylase